METSILLRDYLQILKKHFVLFLVTVLVCLLIGGVITYIFPKSYTSSIDIYVRHKGTETSPNYYTYDGYYSTQASVDYTNTVAGFLESLSTIDNAAKIVETDPLYKQGGYKPVDLSSQPDYLAKFQRNINVKIVAPQLINVSISDSSQDVSQIWAKALGAIVTTNIKQLNQQGDTNFNIDTIHAPITQTNALKLPVDLGIALIIGIFLGFTFGFIAEGKKKQG